MSRWTCEQASAYFETGGEVLPAEVSDLSVGADVIEGDRGVTEEEPAWLSEAARQATPGSELSPGSLLDQLEPTYDGQPRRFGDEPAVSDAGIASVGNALYGDLDDAHIDAVGQAGGGEGAAPPSPPPACPTASMCASSRSP